MNILKTFLSAPKWSLPQFAKNLFDELILNSVWWQGTMSKQMWQQKILKKKIHLLAKNEAFYTDLNPESLLSLFLESSLRIFLKFCVMIGSILDNRYAFPKM